MKHMDNYDTVADAINGLRRKVTFPDLNITFDKLTCRQNDVCLDPNESEITKTCRFEAIPTPSDEDIAYAIKSEGGTMKGFLTTAYGIYDKNMHAALINKPGFHQQ